MRFEEEFPDATIIVLDQNYRSTQRILDAANTVISNNAARKPKHLWTEQVGGELLTRYQAEDEHDEASFVTGRYAAHRHRGAALQRLHGLLPHQRAGPRRRRGAGAEQPPVPRRGGVKFYNRREVKDTLAFSARW